MYLSPNKMTEWDAETSARVTHHHISTPHHVHVNVHLTIRYFRENGTFENAALRVSMRKCGEVWKLQHSITLDSPKLRITVKHVGSEDWTPVELFPFPFGTSGEGTEFKHGDQLDMRYVHSSGQSYPVSFDGTEATNYFPLTICVIQ